MQQKIDTIYIENFKRIKDVSIECNGDGLLIIGGKNSQGKTSVLDAILWALGGDKYRPSEPRHEGSVLPPHIQIKMKNGLIVERKGKNSDLKVIDPSGTKQGQALLNSFIDELALNLPKFLNSTSKDKAKILLDTIGVGDQLYELENTETKLYNTRREIGQIADSKKKSAAEMQSYPDAPNEPVSASELIQQQQAILAKNGENQRLRERADTLFTEYENAVAEVERLNKQLAEATNTAEKVNAELMIAKKSASELQDESTEELERNITDIDEINRQVRVNQDKEHAESEADDYHNQYEDLSVQIENIRNQKLELLNGAQLPLEGLSVVDSELTYQGYKWDNLSSSDQLKVATAIVRKLNPECGFVLLDKLEQMDLDTLNEFGEWLAAEKLQAIATRVSTGEECSIIINDGHIEQKQKEEFQWK